MKKLYYLVYPASLIVFLMPYIPMSIKGVLGFAFILTSCITAGLKPAIITATVCVLLSLYNLIFDINFDEKYKYLSAVLGILLYYLVAYFLGRFADTIKSKNRELRDEIERRKSAEKELSDRLSQMQSLMDTIPNPIFFKDMDCRYIRCNRAFANYIGISEQVLVGKTLEDYYNQDVVKLCGKSDANLIAGYGMQSFEESITYSDGSKRDIILNKDLVMDKQLNPIGIVGVLTDITDQKEAVRLKLSIMESRKILEEMLENDKIKTEFLTNISHEFRTPLNVILGSVQLMELYLTNDQYAVSREKVIKRVAVLKQNSYRLLRLVNNLIDISSIDAKAFEMNFRNCDIVRLIRDITLSVSDYTENEGICVSFETDIESRTMACDDDKIERILLNLLSNSVKFTPKGGKISVRISERQEGLCIKVEDNGIGIPPDKQSMIFQRFCQIDGIFTRKHEGSGIGLSLVKSLVEMHGGTISFVSKVGLGTSFTIFLPYNDVDEEVLKYKVIREPGHMNRISLEFSDIYSIGRQN